MKAYAVLWGIGLVMVVVGFGASMGAGFSAAYTVLIVGGFLLGAAGFLVFARRDQGTVPAARSGEEHLGRRRP